MSRPAPNLNWTAGHPSPLPLTRQFGPHRTTLRFLRPEDAERLTAFFSSHTLETIYGRYGLFVHMSPEKAVQLVGVDQSRDCALGVFEGSTAVLIAIGRYCLSTAGDSAETAFVVREDRRGIGIATALLRELLLIARERGLAKLTAQVEHHNHAMLEIFRRAGAIFTERDYRDAIKVTLGIGQNSSPQNPVKI